MRILILMTYCRLKEGRKKGLQWASCRVKGPLIGYRWALDRPRICKYWVLSNCVGPGVGIVYLLNRASDGLLNRFKYILWTRNGLELWLAHDGSVLEVASRAGPVLSGYVGTAR